MHITLSSALSVSFQKMDASHSLYREMSWKKVYKSHFYWGPHVYGGLKRTEWTDGEGRAAFRALLFISENKKAGEAIVISERSRVSGGVTCVRSLWMLWLVTEKSAKSSVGKCQNTKLFQGGFWNNPNLTDPGLLAEAPVKETQSSDKDIALFTVILIIMYNEVFVWTWK